MIANATIIAGSTLSQILSSRKTITGVIEKKTGTDSFILKSGTERISVQADASALQIGDTVRLRLQKDYAVIERIVPNKQEQQNHSDLYVKRPISYQSISTVLDSFLARLETPENIDTSLPNRLLTVINALSASEESIDADLIGKIQTIAESLDNQNQELLFVRSTSQELRDLLISLKQSITNSTTGIHNSSHAIIIEIPREKLAEGIFRLEQIPDIHETDLDAISQISKNVKSVEPLYARTIPTEQGTIAVVLSESQLSQELHTWSHSLTSRFLKSIPTQVFQNLVISRGNLILPQLQELDQQLSSTQHTLQQMRAGSGDAQSAVIEQWLTSALDNMPILPEMVKRLPGTPAALPHILKELSTQLSSHGYPELSLPEEPGVSLKKLESTGNKKVFLPSVFRELGLDYEHRILSGTEARIKSDLKDNLLALNERLPELQYNRSQPSTDDLVPSQNRITETDAGARPIPQNTAIADSVSSALKTLFQDLGKQTQMILDSMLITSEQQHTDHKAVEKQINSLSSILSTLPERISELAEGILKEAEPIPVDPTGEALSLPTTQILSKTSKNIIDDLFVSVLTDLPSLASTTLTNEVSDIVQNLPSALKEYALKTLPVPSAILTVLLQKLQSISTNSLEANSRIHPFIFNQTITAVQNGLEKIGFHLFEKVHTHSGEQIKADPTLHNQLTANQSQPGKNLPLSTMTRVLAASTAIDLTQCTISSDQRLRELQNEISSFTIQHNPESLIIKPDRINVQTLYSSGTVQNIVQKAFQEISSALDSADSITQYPQAQTGQSHSVHEQSQQQSPEEVKGKIAEIIKAASKEITDYGKQALNELGKVTKESEVAAPKDLSGKLQFTLNQIATQIEKSVDDLIQKFRGLEAILKHAPDDLIRGPASKRDSVTLSNNTPITEKDTALNQELSSKIQQQLRQSVETVLNRLESIQLLARQVPTSEGAQQILALPMKIGGEWTEVNIRFIKKHASKKKQQSTNHFKVLLNVAPSRLGAISVKIDYERKKHLSLTLDFESESTKSWFLKNRNGLQRVIHDLGLPLTGLDLRMIRFVPGKQPVETSQSRFDLKI